MKNRISKIKKVRASGIDKAEIVSNIGSEKPLPCPHCHKTPEISGIKELIQTWNFKCGWGDSGTIVMIDYKTRDHAITMYNAMVNSIKQEKGEDVIIEIIVAKNHSINVSCNAMVDGWAERIESNRSRIVKAIKGFAR